ncbi:GSCFA domain-containing protein [Flavobacterium hercynium]|uniref:GSCFA domain-containing protein n=1 Tax=Flavobacterium hercynium TaxID=387094 RepID=A0A226GMZ4_9FLAO|nr:GSCFA domain-containing protein [Flavobacterium hercynium]OXA83393.1 GSCFA domain-containing protein [Flavobacterium hercynium]SMP31579.1 GSCFA family protein [Flavobacterium hercynium]
MNFRTPISIAKTAHPIDYNSKIISIGSCFAENMAKKFDYFKFQNTTNPFGIIFNSVSIEKIVRRVVEQHFFTESDIFLHNDLWHCYEIHSELSNSNKEELLQSLNQIITATHDYLTHSTHIIITYGTSWIYRNIQSEQIVANCHKVPQKQFTKELLPVSEIENSIQNTVQLIQKLNPDINFIFTVSPVRHIKDGFIENQLSKAHLFSAIHQVLKIHNSQFTTLTYFPSYEIMMDELRDYRFYAEDMLHPNQVAIDFIWKLFIDSNIALESVSVMQEVEEIQKGLNHRSFNPESEQHLKFLSKLHQKIDILKSKFPQFKF